MHSLLFIALIFQYPDVADWALSASKALQVLLPLGLFVLFRELPWQERLLRATFARRHPKASPEEAEEWYELYQRRFGRVLGFLAWKVGCDLGFYVVMGPDWIQAFTLAGLIPYTIAQYFIYRLFGQKMLLSGMMNPFDVETYKTPSLQRHKPWRRSFSKFFHEDMNATSPHVPMRRVILKPLADYLAVVVCWSLYSMGIFFVQSGEINWQPMQRFPHAFMIGMYFGGVMAFVLGYNIGDYLSVHIRYTILEWLRASPSSGKHPEYWRRSIRWRILPFSKRYGVRLPGTVSILCGIAMVAFLSPRFLQLSLSTAHSAEIALFIHRGEISPKQLLQITPVAPPAISSGLPDFDEQWNKYLALTEGGK
jgi:hypothetical protein